MARQVTKAAVIGAGPAGIAAAVQLKRHDIDPLIFEAERVGGLLRNANLVENYPGFPSGITGPALVRLLERHLERSGVTLLAQRIERVSLGDRVFRLETDHRTYTADYVIIATGTVPKTPDWRGFGEIKERTSHEIAGLGRLRDQSIAIIGAGDAAFDYALSLARHNQVWIINRGKRRKCLPLLWRRARRAARINYLDDRTIQTLRLQDGRVQIRFRGRKAPVLADQLVCAIGRIPNRECLSGIAPSRQDRLARSGRLLLVGDVHNGYRRQTAIAVGEGIAAAMRVAREIFKS